MGNGETAQRPLASWGSLLPPGRPVSLPWFLWLAGERSGPVSSEESCPGYLWNSNTDVAPFLRQEFILIRPIRKGTELTVWQVKAWGGTGRVGCSAPLSFIPKGWFLPRGTLLHPVSPSPVPGPARSILNQACFPLSSFNFFGHPAFCYVLLNSWTPPPAVPLVFRPGHYAHLACCSSLLPGCLLPHAVSSPHCRPLKGIINKHSPSSFAFEPSGCLIALNLKSTFPGESCKILWTCPCLPGLRALAHGFLAIPFAFAFTNPLSFCV